MKFIIVLACLAIFVATTQAQVSTTTITSIPSISPNPDRRPCKGHKWHSSCIGLKNEGYGRIYECMKNSNDMMWYFNSERHECQPMMYKGCGGNSNRHCTKESCDQLCQRIEN